MIHAPIDVRVTLDPSKPAATPAAAGERPRGDPIRAALAREWLVATGGDPTGWTRGDLLAWYWQRIARSGAIK